MAKKEKLKYEPPFGKPLTAFSVSGQEPQGQCGSGDYPFWRCRDGLNYVASCIGGLGVDVSACGLGAVHKLPNCNFGGSATTACISGFHQSG